MITQPTNPWLNKLPKIPAQSDFLCLCSTTCKKVLVFFTLTTHWTKKCPGCNVTTMTWKKTGSTFLEKKSKFPTIRHVLDSLSVLPWVVSKQVVVTSPPGESRGPPSWKPHWPDEVKPTIPHGQLPTAMTAPRCNAGCEEMPPKYPSQPNRTPPWATGYVNKEQNILALVGGARMFELDCVVFCFF